MPSRYDCIALHIRAEVVVTEDIVTGTAGLAGQSHNYPLGQWQQGPSDSAGVTLWLGL